MERTKRLQLTGHTAFFLSAGLPGKAGNGREKEKWNLEFLKSKEFWLITGLLFCQNAAETSVTGWLVTYYKGQGILNGVFNTYTVTIMWGATLFARLLIAFVIPIRNTFKALYVCYSYSPSPWRE